MRRNTVKSFWLFEEEFLDWWKNLFINYLKPAEMKTFIHYFLQKQKVKKYFSYLPLLALVIVFLSGCNTNKENLISGFEVNKLNYLYVEKARFQQWWQDHHTKTMFRFTFSMNQITLTGWAPDNKNDDADDYDMNDVLKLKSSTQQVAFLNSKLYFGNVKLSRRDDSIINSLLTSIQTARYVLFEPKIFTVYKGHIAYQAHLSTNTNSSGIISMASGSVKADPSPPATRK